MTSPSDQACVIIGAGVMGASCAFFLSQKGFKPVVLEASGSPAAASSGKAGGFLARDWCDGGAVQHLARCSFDLHAQLMAGGLGGGDVSTLGYRRCEAVSLHLGKGSRRFQCDVPSWVDASCADSASLAAPADAAMQVHPRRLTMHLLAQAEAAGARVVCNSQLSEVHVDADGRICAVSVTDARQAGRAAQRYDAAFCVFCMGPWTQLLPPILLKHSPRAAAAVAACLPNHNQRVHSIVVDDCLRVCGATALFCSGISLDDPEVYPRPDGTVYMCGGSSFDPLPPSADDVVADAEVVQQLQVRAPEHQRLHTHLTAIDER
jgi:glycine/D-amino acid oxidase-like deaminating enzyme